MDGAPYLSSESVSQSGHSRYYAYFAHLYIFWVLLYSTSLSISDPEEILVEEQEPSSSRPNDSPSSINVIPGIACHWAKRKYQPTLERFKFLSA